MKSLAWRAIIALVLIFGGGCGRDGRPRGGMVRLVGDARQYGSQGKVRECAQGITTVATRGNNWMACGLRV